MFFVRTIYVNIVTRMERSPVVDPPRKTERPFPAGRADIIYFSFFMIKINPRGSPLNLSCSFSYSCSLYERTE